MGTQQMLSGNSQANHEAESQVHGGDLQQASERYAVPLEQWIDLSTGINPQAYPLTEFDVTAFQQLPYLKADFVAAAKTYYLGNANNNLDETNMLAVAGSQAIIQLLPECLPDLPVLVPELGYQEHRFQWQQSGAWVREYPSINQAESVSFINNAIQQNNRQHLVIINPNNPSGLCFKPYQLNAWAKSLGEGAFIIIDEAFVDTNPELSVLKQSFEPNMIVLRSFGKFFGLAGLRLGFVFAKESLMSKFRQCLGLWAINGPAQSIATRAFQNTAWQNQARSQIKHAAQLRQTLFSTLFTGLASAERHEPLFSSYWLPRSYAKEAHLFFAKQGILLRLIATKNEFSLLRIGSLDPDKKNHLKQIETAIEINKSLQKKPPN